MVAIRRGFLDPPLGRQQRLVGIGKTPLREVGRGGDADQSHDPFRARQRDQQRQPAAHRRSDQQQRSLRQPVDQGQSIVTPAGERAVLEPALAGAATGIVEPQHRPALLGGPGVERDRLAPFHVGHVARQEGDGRPLPRTMAIGEAQPVGTRKKLGGRFGRVQVSKAPSLRTGARHGPGLPCFDGKNSPFP